MYIDTRISFTMNSPWYHNWWQLVLNIDRESDQITKAVASISDLLVIGTTMQSELIMLHAGIMSELHEVHPETDNWTNQLNEWINNQLMIWIRDWRCWDLSANVAFMKSSAQNTFTCTVYCIFWYYENSVRCIAFSRCIA